MKEEFLDYYEKEIKPREKVPGELLKWLESSDFFIAPASTRFHGNHKQGLLIHSIKVYDRLFNLMRNAPEKEIYNNSTIAIVALLHDLCKVNFYKISWRNVKDEKTGVWYKKEYYEVSDSWPYGHGEKSVEIISRFIDLTRDEKLAIRWHMAWSDEAVKGGSYALSAAMEICPLIAYLHCADNLAAACDERKE